MTCSGDSTSELIEHSVSIFSRFAGLSHETPGPTPTAASAWLRSAPVLSNSCRLDQRSVVASSDALPIRKLMLLNSGASEASAGRSRGRGARRGWGRRATHKC